jgi:hypothetical protein
VETKGRRLHLRDSIEGRAIQVGFKHDEDCPHLTEGRFVVLSRPVPKRTFLGKLFGR